MPSIRARPTLRRRARVRCAAACRSAPPQDSAVSSRDMRRWGRPKSSAVATVRDKAKATTANRRGPARRAGRAQRLHACTPRPRAPRRECRRCREQEALGQELTHQRLAGADGAAHGDLRRRAAARATACSRGSPSRQRRMAADRTGGAAWDGVAGQRALERLEPHGHRLVLGCSAARPAAIVVRRACAAACEPPSRSRPMTM